DREGTLKAAVGRLRHLPETEVLRVSTLRDTDPVGYIDQPRFLNGVVELGTGLSARRLLGRLLELERAFGRDPAAVPVQVPRRLVRPGHGAAAARPRSPPLGERRHRRARSRGSPPTAP